jgi:hypothetical protein
LIVVPIALGAILSQNKLGIHSNKSILIKLLAVWLPTIFFFVIGYAVSVWHSWESIGKRANDFKQSSLTEFLLSHLRQTTSRENSAPWDYISDPFIILPIMIVSASFLLIRSLWWTPLIVVIGSFLFTGGANDRRVFVFTLILLIIAATEYSRRSRRRTAATVQDYNGDQRTRSISALKTASTTLYLVLAFSSISTQEIVFQKTASSISALAKEVNSGGLSPNHLIPSSQASMIQKLRAIEDPILTSGWWQFPEYRIWGDFEFHDRMDLELPGRLGSPERIYLLFDESITAWPKTSIDLCSREVYRDETVVLCLFRDDLPLNTLE